MLQENKVAVIFGAGGPIGGAVGRALAREGTFVFLSGRTQAKLDKVASEIRANGGVGETAVVDALDEASVDEHVDSVAVQAGRIDVSFNLISYGDVHRLLTQLSVEDFLKPITNAMRTHFLTTRAAARHLTRQKSGAILALGGSGPHTLAGLGGFKIALDALEGLRRQWACELGPHGIRVVTLKTGGVPESLPANIEVRREIISGIEQASLLHRAATLDDVGNVAAFVASDKARTMTAADVNISCGAIMD